MIIPSFGFALPQPEATEAEQIPHPHATIDAFLRMIDQPTGLTANEPPPVGPAIDEELGETASDYRLVAPLPQDPMQRLPILPHGTAAMLAQPLTASPLIPDVDTGAHETAPYQPDTLQNEGDENHSFRTATVAPADATLSAINIPQASPPQEGPLIPQGPSLTAAPLMDSTPAMSSAFAETMPPRPTPAPPMQAIAISTAPAFRSGDNANGPLTPRLLPQKPAIAAEHISPPPSVQPIPQNLLPIIQGKREQPALPPPHMAHASPPPPQPSDLQPIDTPMLLTIAVTSPRSKHPDALPPPPISASLIQPKTAQLMQNLTIPAEPPQARVPPALEAPENPPPSLGSEVSAIPSDRPIPTLPHSLPASGPPTAPPLAIMTSHSTPALELQNTPALFREQPTHSPPPPTTTTNVGPTPLTLLPERIHAQHQAGHPRVIEITLSPPELGQLRLHMQPEGDHIQVILSAEHSTTLELMRRNAEWLSTSLKDLGFSSNSFSFTSWQGSDSQNMAKGQERSAPPTPHYDNAPQNSEEHEQTYLAARSRPHQQNSGLDLRL